MMNMFHFIPNWLQQSWHIWLHHTCTCTSHSIQKVLQLIFVQHNDCQPRNKLLGSRFWLTTCTTSHLFRKTGCARCAGHLQNGQCKLLEISPHLLMPHLLSIFFLNEELPLSASIESTCASVLLMRLILMYLYLNQTPVKLGKVRL